MQLYLGAETRRRSRNSKSKMTERKRPFSPKYQPLIEESEPSEEASLITPEHQQQRHRRESGERQEAATERVAIVSGSGEDRENGDADSGISLSEVMGEDHSAAGGAGGSPVKGDKHQHQESLGMLVIQILIPFFFAGFGMMAAGLLLDAVQVVE